MLSATDHVASLEARIEWFCTQVLGMNGCEAFSSCISAALHGMVEEESSHALEALCAKTSKALRSFWLGAPGMDQPELRPPALMEGVAHPVLEEYSTALQGHPPVTALTGRVDELEPDPLQQLHCGLFCMPFLPPQETTPFYNLTHQKDMLQLFTRI